MARATRKARADARVAGQEQASASVVGQRKGNRSGGRWRRGVGGRRMSDDAGERLAAGPDRAEAARVGTNFREGPMTEAQTSDTMSTELRKVAERARRDPDTRFHSLAHLIDQAALRRTFHRQRGNAAAGVDGACYDGVCLPHVHGRQRSAGTACCCASMLSRRRRSPLSAPALCCTMGRRSQSVPTLRSRLASSFDREPRSRVARLSNSATRASEIPPFDSGCIDLKASTAVCTESR